MHKQVRNKPGGESCRAKHLVVLGRRASPLAAVFRPEAINAIVANQNRTRSQVGHTERTKRIRNGTRTAGEPSFVAHWMQMARTSQTRHTSSTAPQIELFFAQTVQFLKRQHGHVHSEENTSSRTPRAAQKSKSGMAPRMRTSAHLPHRSGPLHSMQPHRFSRGHALQRGKEETWHPAAPSWGGDCDSEEPRK